VRQGTAEKQPLADAAFPDKITSKKKVKIQTQTFRREIYQKI